MPGLVRLNDFGFIPVLLTTRLHLISISVLASSHSVSRWKSWRIPGCQAGLGRMPPPMSHCYHGYADDLCSYPKSVPIGVGAWICRKSSIFNDSRETQIFEIHCNFNGLAYA